MKSWMITMLIFSSCTTYSVTVVHSEGQASDMVDEVQSQTPSTTVAPNTSIPLSLIKK
jgi:hypothetical protein